jgi:hypothetical protein
VVSSIVFPNNSKIKVLAIDEVNTAQQYQGVNFVIEGASQLPHTRLPGGPGGAATPWAGSVIVTSPRSEPSRLGLVSRALDRVSSRAALPRLEAPVAVSGLLGIGALADPSDAASADGPTLNSLPSKIFSHSLPSFLSQRTRRGRGEGSLVPALLSPF